MIVVLPVLAPLLCAALGLAAWRSVPLQRSLAVMGSAAQLAAGVWLLVTVQSSGPLVSHMANWPAPFAITLVADTLGALMVVLTGLVGLVTTIYALAEVGRDRQQTFFFPLLLVMLMGVAGAFLTGDIFNLYVCFEIMLIASFVLLSLGGERAQIEGALKYVSLNLLSSALFLAAVGVLYGATGTLDFAHLAQVVPGFAAQHPQLAAAVAGLFLMSFAIKAGLFPLYFWLPSSYHTPSVSVSAVFAGLLTKVGVYALLRVMTLVFPVIQSIPRLLLWGAAFTMLAGALGAVSQYHIRRILGFHIVSQIGYMVMGLGLLSSADENVRRLGLMAAVFYIAHHIVVKTNLFLITGLIRRLRGSEQLKTMGGLYLEAPWLAALFVIPAASLAGIPPLSGFWAKLSMIRAGLQAEEWAVVLTAILAGVLTLMSMVKIWNEAFWKPLPSTSEALTPVARGQLMVLVAPIVVLAAITVAIGVWPQFLVDIADEAAGQLRDPALYIHAVGLAP